MSVTYKYQDGFATDLANSWLNGNREHVRITIRGLKNKAQAAYIAACVYAFLEDKATAEAFRSFMHPNY